MNKTFLPKAGLGAPGMGEGSIFSELDWWQQGLMRQGLESGSFSDLTPQGLARADAEGTAALLRPPQPGYPGVEKTISVPRPYVTFKSLGRTLALGRVFLVCDEYARKQQRESHVLGSFLLSSLHSMYGFFNFVTLVLLNYKMNNLPGKPLMYLAILVDVISVLRQQAFYKGSSSKCFLFCSTHDLCTKVCLCLYSVQVTIFNNV